MQTTRRSFLGAAAAGVALAQKAPETELVVGMIGVGVQGTSRLREFSRNPTCGSGRSAMSIARTRPRRRRRSKKPADTSPKCSATSAAPRQTRDRRGRDPDAGSLACDHRRARDGGGQGRLRREAARYSVAEGRAMADASTQPQARDADGQPHPQHRAELPRRRGTRAIGQPRTHPRVQCWRTWNAAAHQRRARHRSRTGTRLRLLARPGAETPV